MTYPSFTAGDVLAASDMNAVGLWLVKTHTISSAATSHEITSAFSSTYDNYRIVGSGLKTVSVAGLRFLLGATITGYYYGGLYVSTASAVTGNGGANQADWDFQVVCDSTYESTFVLDVLKPHDAAITNFSCAGSDNRTTGFPGRWSGGFVNNTTSYTSFKIAAGVNITAGTIRVYGYRD